MREFVLVSWLLKVTLAGLGVWALASLVAAMRRLPLGGTSRWKIGSVALFALGPFMVYAISHAALLKSRRSIEAGRDKYERFGDPRMTEARLGTLRGWILDCSGRNDRAFASYELLDGVLQRRFPHGEAGANFVGGLTSRDYSIESLFADSILYVPAAERSTALHAVGRDLHLSLCADVVDSAQFMIAREQKEGVVVVQEISTGAIIAYAASGLPSEAPLGVMEYLVPGSVFKLALSAVWWDHGLPDMSLPCPGSITVDGAIIRNAKTADHGTVVAPHDMLVYSCNTTAVRMAQILRERVRISAIADAYREFGITAYAGSPPRARDTAFWRTSSTRWNQRMAPPIARIRLSDTTSNRELAQLSIGQGPLDMTVMHVSRLIQAIGNDGVMLDPMLEGSATSRPVGKANERRVMKASTARRLRAAMLDVVDHGTARRERLRLIAFPGWKLGGKTGTSQIPGQLDDGWFAGLLADPSGSQRYSIVVYLRGAGQGGDRPASVAGNLAALLAMNEGN